MADGIRKVGKGVYEINFRLGKGVKRYQRRIKAPSLYEARSARIRLMEEHLTSSNGQNADKMNAPFSILRNQLIRDMESDNLAYKTINRGRSTFDLFFLTFLPLKYPKVKRLKDISLECLYEYKNYVTVDLHRLTGWRSELGTLKAIFGRLTRLGYCGREFKDSLKDIKKPQCIIKDFTNIQRDGKVALLDFIETDRPAYYGVTYFLIRLGWRIEETLSVKRTNIRLDGAEPVSIKLEAAIRKNRKEFVLESIDTGLSGIIKSCLSDGSQSQWLFPNSRGNKIKADHYRNYLAKVSQEIIDRRITPHDFRRSLVTDAAREGLSIKDVMAITGHADMKVLLRHYSFSTDAGRKKVLNLTKVK